MDYQKVLLGLLPPVSYARNTNRHRAQAKIDGGVLDQVSRLADNASASITPLLAGLLLVAWERLLDIDGVGKNYQQRVARVVSKINAVGGLSIPYFIQLAAAAGYRIEIEEPQPFRAGINRAGDAVAPEDIIWTWRVHVQKESQNIWRFRAGGSVAGSRLTEYSDDVIETVFKDLKPAHTWVGFSYGATK
ncbi:DUF2313 domain-containing protein [Neisseria brasiliensis]|uniref:YmfQ family protein n=1 Tax=Neisseria TaxID=482 RepID=UPI000C27724F|nr:MULTISPECIES: YmfQ family protein [Neisseria]PJO78408.1 phage tail protein [Neisseria sp. N177_16]QGL26099.1 DUF2313 domain-containing protein [Neisseria brasiliensis]